jgi:hypothetical protein
MRLEANGITRCCLPGESSWPMPRPTEDDGRR